MDLPKRLALAWTRWRYRKPVIADTPRNQVLFAVGFGGARKFFNYFRGRRAYRRGLVEVPTMPWVLRVEPFTHCNLRCPLCPTGAGELDRSVAALDVATFERILDQLGHWVFAAHMWVWGEPLINRQLAELIAVASSRRIATEISSNLSLRLTDEQIDALIRAGLTWLIVSLDGARAETYVQYRVRGDFALVLDNMRRFVERKRALGSPTPFIEWQFVPLRHNEHEREDAARLAAQIGVDGLRFKPARLDKTANITFHGQVPASLAQKWKPQAPELRHDTRADGGGYLDYHCTFLWSSVTVYPDGAVARCCETHLTRDDLGNLLTTPFRQIWNGPDYRESRLAALGQGTEGSVCHGCKVFTKPSAARDSDGVRR
jgi:radical SAM protein with 4Fe4S-binding SPASM domain